MSSFARVALAAPVALALAGTAHADENHWSFGIGSVYIGSATPVVNVVVQNTSASTDPDDRVLEMTSDAPDFALHGQVFCKAILGGTTRLVESQVLFGNAVLVYTNPGTAVWSFGWDETAPIVFDGNVAASNVDFAHEIDLPTTWNGGLSLGFNPVEVVEKRLAKYVDNGGTPAEFLKQDDVFEVKVPVNLVGVCENDSDYGVAEYAGFTTREITVAIFYKGDPDIEEDIVAYDVPSEITENTDIPLRLRRMIGTSVYTYDGTIPLELRLLLERYDDGTSDPTEPTRR